MPKKANSLQKHLESMVKELSELRAVKAAHDALAQSYNDLTRMIAKATGMNFAGGKRPGRPAGPSRGTAKAKKVSRKGSGGKRFRSTAADVQKAYDALASKVAKEWMTKEAICKAAGYKPAQVHAAWKRLMEGGKGADGKTVKPLLESNGSRGLQGRYRRR